MIAIKTVLFLVALGMSIEALEEFVEKIIQHIKTDRDEYNVLREAGMITTIDFWSTFIAVICWTGFYLLNQL